MSISSVELHDFSAFGDAAIDLAPGINVFLGGNATGKTHAMKALYSVVQSRPHEGSGRDVAARLKEKLARVFRPEDGQIGRLVRRGPGQRSAKVRVHSGQRQLGFSIYSRDSSVRILKRRLTTVPPALFLPPQELLAMYEGFIAAYQHRELAFDETYFDAMVALSAAALRGPKPPQIAAALREFRAILGGYVVRKGDRFYLAGHDGNLEAPLLAEGMRKLAGIAHLLVNGTLAARGLLLWDEPEANLNPVLVRRVADLLVVLAKTGMQIVVASHDYLFTQTLNLHAEGGAPVRFFGFARDAEGVTVTSADGLDGIPENLIRAAFLAHYDRARGVEDAASPRGKRG